MTYAINGLEPAPFAPLFDLDDSQLEAARIVRMTVDNPNFPCRVSLRDCELGDEVLLLNHVRHDGANPYRGSHAIFVGRSATRWGASSTESRRRSTAASCRCTPSMPTA